jgi:hypothetical protein
MLRRIAIIAAGLAVGELVYRTGHVDWGLSFGAVLATVWVLNRWTRPRPQRRPPPAAEHDLWSDDHDYEVRYCRQCGEAITGFASQGYCPLCGHHRQCPSCDHS